MHNFRNGEAEMQRGKVRLKLKAVVGQGSFFHWYWQWWWCSCCFLVDAMIWMMFHLRGWWLIMVGKLLRRALISTGEWETILCNTLFFYFPIYYQHQSIPNNLWVGNLLIQKKTISSKKSTLFLNELQTYILIRDSLLPRISYRVIADCAQIQSILNGGTDLSNPPRI